MEILQELDEILGHCKVTVELEKQAQNWGEGLVFTVGQITGWWGGQGF